MSSPQSITTPKPVDPRGPRFGAAITTVVLAVILILGPGVPALVLLLIQTVAFGLGALVGLGAQPYGLIYKSLVRPRLSAPSELEDPRPPRFAQTVGLVFAVAGLIGLVASLPVLLYVAIGFALVAAVLNSVFNFCLGCELYLLGRRALGNPLAARFVAVDGPGPS
jgi:hypothetical protein